ncbi:MFS transporter [Aeromicrobium sp. PE09-221]|uniref:MFS transporter n=1 Tax=Aeromicrobium sp. PE09-221 TaxID=1898043 RepID=UPI000B6D8956|nr:MFS transporter [Aeromicrobium sp. PE09-221]OUZ12692.1 MFS transporter [Aeromicrobium sp. PE09-221]
MPSPQTRIVTMLSLVQVIGGIGNGAGLAIGALLIGDISGSDAWAGTATVALTLGAALFTIPLSRLAARRGRRPALTTGWWLGAFGAGVTIGAAVLVSLPLALVGLVLFGASTSANLQSRFAAADRAEPQQVGRAISIVVWSTTIGAVTGPNLTGPGAAVAGWIGIPSLSGPMVFSLVAYGLAGLLTFAFLRPEPLIREVGAAPERGVIARALPHIRGRAAIAVLTVAIAHAIMVSVMALTPVHMQGHGAALEIIGLTISLHIAGMYALSPVMGWLTDRVGADATILLGMVTLVIAVALAGTSGHSETRITAGLILLGLGWSASVIAGAALLTHSVEHEVRPLVQGLSDLTMNLSGAAGGLVAGLVVATLGFGALNLAAALLTIPVVVAVLNSRREPTPSP